MGSKYLHVCRSQRRQGQFSGHVHESSLVGVWSCTKKVNVKATVRLKVELVPTKGPPPMQMPRCPDAVGSHLSNGRS
jgi:hypothetical protein